MCSNRTNTQGILVRRASQRAREREREISFYCTKRISYLCEGRNTLLASSELPPSTPSTCAHLPLAKGRERHGQTNIANKSNHEDAHSSYVHSDYNFKPLSKVSTRDAIKGDGRLFLLVLLCFLMTF